MYYGELRISKKSSQILEKISSTPNDDKRYVQQLFDATFNVEDAFISLFPDLSEKREIKKRFRDDKLYKIMKCNFRFLP